MALAANALTTVAQVKAVVSAIQAGADETLAERLINVFSLEIERTCCRSFGKAVVVDEPHARPAGREVVLRRSPITSIQAIKLAGDAVGATTYSVKNADAGIIRFAFDIPNNDLVVAGSCTLDTQPGSGDPDLLVSYTAGFVLPKDATAENPQTLPFDLEDACIQCVASAWTRKGVDLAAAAFDQANEAIGRALSGRIPGPVMPTLRRWTRWR